jgi:tRNA threonylcarbamoyladenosine biosynthesis protein TsaB
MILLVVDTALDACAAAVVTTGGGDRTVVAESETIGRGHAERVMTVIGRAVDRAGIRLADVDAFAASVGPGSFTGIRVGVAAVRGFAVATGRPAIGVSSLDALAREAAVVAPGRPILAVLDARKDEVYTRAFAADLSALGPPSVVAVEIAAEEARRLGAVLVGSGAPLVAARAPDLAVAGTQRFAAIETLAGLAADRLALGDRTPPAPLYVRAPDAKPQSAHRLARLTPSRPGEGGP